jgi:hypothetical protein
MDENVIKETVIHFVAPILKEINWLASELSASHVVRSIVCLLSGLPVIAEKKVRISNICR